MTATQPLCPLPALPVCWPQAPDEAERQHSGAVLGAFEAALRRRGLTRLYGAADADYGVLSVTIGLTIWCDGRTLTWQQPDGGRATWPATDPGGAAARLAGPARDDDSPGSPPPQHRQPRYAPPPDTAASRVPQAPPSGKAAGEQDAPAGAATGEEEQRAPGALPCLPGPTKAGQEAAVHAGEPAVGTLPFQDATARDGGPHEAPPGGQPDDGTGGSGETGPAQRQQDEPVRSLADEAAGEGEGRAPGERAQR